MLEHLPIFQPALSLTARSSLILAFLALVLGACAMGISPIFVRHADIGPISSAFYRVALALPFLLIWMLFEKRNSSNSADVTAFPIWPVALSGIFFAGDLFFWHLAIMNTTVANATFLACLAPVWVALLSQVTIGEAVSRQAIGGLLLCLVGMALLIGSSWQVDAGRLIGDVYGFITSIFFGLYFLAVRVARRTLPAARLTFYSTCITSLLLLVAALLAGGTFWPQTQEGLAALLALGLVSHTGGQGLLAVALGVLSATFSSLVIFIEAVAAAVFGYVFLGEELVPLQLGGGALILLGIWVARPRRENAEATPTA